MTEKLKGISGSMCAGKTRLLIEEARRDEYKKESVLAFKPAIDNRWEMPDFLVSREKDGNNLKTYPAHSVSNPSEIIDIVLQKINTHGWVDNVIIDEVQLFDDSIIDVIKYLLDADIKVIFGGLATDFRGEPFGSMPTLLALADEIKKPSAVCVYEQNGDCCGDNATRTQRLINGKPANYNDPVIMIGDIEYEPRCVKHHQVPGKPKPKI